MTDEANCKFETHIKQTLERSEMCAMCMHLKKKAKTWRY